MPPDAPQLFISCLGLRERIILEDAIVDAISAEKDGILRLERNLEVVPSEAVHTVQFFIQTGKDRIEDLEELRQVIARAKLCVPEGG